jgi:hypothetical protein
MQPVSPRFARSVPIPIGAPVALMFWQRPSATHRTLAAIGRLFLGAGLLAAVLIGCLAPFPQTYEPLHIPLALATFIGISAGLAVCLAVAAPRAQSRRRNNPVLMALASFMGAVVLVSSTTGVPCLTASPTV